MGLIREIAQLNYRATRTEQERRKREERKAIENNLKNDLKQVLKANLLSFQEKYDVIYLLNNDNKIMIQTIEEVKKLKYQNDFKYKDILNDLKAYEYLEDIYLKSINDIRKKKELLLKEQNKQALKILINKMEVNITKASLTCKLSKSYFIKGLLLSEERDLIIREILEVEQDYYYEQLDSLYLKAYKYIRDKYKNDPIIQPEERKEEKLILPWRLLLYGKAIKLGFKTLFK